MSDKPRIMTVLGTRPEIIRLSRIIAKLDPLCEHLVIHTGQNFDPELDEIFFRDLQVRRPDRYLNARGSFGEQMAVILPETEKIMHEFKPERLLILGDTNSGLAAVVAKRLGIGVYHMEAGNRCRDDRVPEEVNRRIIDHSSDVLMPYTQNSKQNLLLEGVPPHRIFVTGNPILEVINHYEPQIARSRILEELGLEPGRFFLVTLHRAENVDIEARLKNFFTALEELQRSYNVPVIVSTHPRTASRMKAFGFSPAADPQIRFLKPFGFFDFR